MKIFSRIKEGLAKTSNILTSGITSVISQRKLDSQAIEELTDLLIAADLGVSAAQTYTSKLAKTKFEKDISPNMVKEFLAKEIAHDLSVTEKEIIFSCKPYVMLFCGVNGNGKTTTIGKIAAKYSALGKKVLVAACDTFRAAAPEQLALWAKKLSIAIETGSSSSADPASVAYKAYERAYKENFDILLIDTAGRMHNKTNLMEELKKTINIGQKFHADNPNEIILVIDATTGQNAHQQVVEFSKFAKLTGLIITKLDGTAKAGVVVGIAEKFKLPIYFIGVGEQAEDLQNFSAHEFAFNLLGCS